VLLRALPPAPRALAGDPPRDDMERTIAGLWARALHLESVGIHDDFIELGGDSLTAQEVVTRLASELGVRLPSLALAQSPTVAELAALAKQAAEPTKTSDAGVTRHQNVVALKTTGTGLPIFFFAGAGGLIVQFLGLAAHFDGERPVYGVQAHGIESRGVPDWTIPGAARRHLKVIRRLQPHGPYLLAGHSFGGLVAMEAAHHLRAAGEEVALLTLIDTTPPGGVRLNRRGGFEYEPDHPAAAQALARAAALAEASNGGAPAEAMRTLAKRAESLAQPLLASASAGRRAVGSVLGGLAERAGQLGESQKFADLSNRVAEVGRLPLAGLVHFPEERQVHVFYNQGMLVTMYYHPEPWTGRTLLFQASAGVPENPELRPIDGRWAPLLTGKDSVARTVQGSHENILRPPVVDLLARDLRAQIAELGL
jgi:thioesterase domain-containing protein/acyl carrier protein